MASDWKNTIGSESENLSLELVSKNTYVPWNYVATGSQWSDSYLRSREKTHSVSAPRTHSGIPGWRGPTNYRRYILRFSHTPGVWRNAGWPWIEEQSGYHTISSNLDAVFPNRGRVVADDNVFNQVKTECLLKLGDGKASWGASLAEAVKSSNSLAQSASNAFTLLLNLKHGRLDAAARFAKGLGISGTYLKTHFGLVPLLNDLYGSYELIKEPAQRGMVLHAKRSVGFGDSDDRWGWGSDFKNVHNSWTGTAMCSIWAKVNTEALRNATRLGLTNPLSIAWELVPWSFALDWVMPVGNVLNALQATNGLEFLDGSISSSAKGTFSADRKGRDYWEEVAAQTVTGEYSNYERWVLNGFPIPLPYVKSPFSSSHLTTAVALWRQLTR